jgi:hypothetical protein
MRLVLFVLAGLLCQECFAQSASSYAVQLNSSRVFRHDSRWRGAEVIYRSSGIATEADARRWWLNSPAHRRLLLSGAITDIACVGNVCVGRGSGSVSKTVQVQRNRTRLRVRR